MRQDIFHLEDYFTNDELASFDEIIPRLEHDGIEKRFDYNQFSNEVMSRHILLDDGRTKDFFDRKIRPLFPDEDIILDNAMVIEVYKPWDVHNDLFGLREGLRGHYNIMIPLTDCDSSTVIFDQTSDRSADFKLYKEEHEQLSSPIDLDIWNQHLDHCREEDRTYLSIKEIAPFQRRGQLHAFPRNLFHSSDNFLKKGITKVYVQLTTAIL